MLLANDEMEDDNSDDQGPYTSSELRHFLVPYKRMFNNPKFAKKVLCTVCDSRRKHNSSIMSNERPTKKGIV